MAVNGVIEAMLDKDPVKCLERTEHVDTKGVLTAFEFRHALSMIILASAVSEFHVYVRNVESQLFFIRTISHFEL
uniref:HEAT repeat-containing protein 1 n=1 Tax=Parascaris univalens TaxID=6257 RepID=A0A915A027_PARUN